VYISEKKDVIVNLSHQITKLEKSAVKIDITVSSEDVVAERQKLLAKYVKELQIPGFRKGYVPVSVIERKFSDTLKKETTDKLIEQATETLFEQIAEKPLPYCRPAINAASEYSLVNDFTFSLQYDVFPKIETVHYDGITVSEAVVEIGEADVVEELAIIQERNALIKDKSDNEAAEKGDVVTVDYCLLDEAGDPAAAHDNYVLTVGTDKDTYRFDDDVVGMKKGEIKEITKTYPADFEDATFAGTTQKIRVTVKAVKIMQLPELDDDFAQDVSEKYQTLADLKTDIAQRLKADTERRIRALKVQSLIAQLIERNPVDIPASMIEAEKYIRRERLAEQFQIPVERLAEIFSSGENNPDNLFKKWTGKPEDDIKGELIIDSLITSKNISVTDAEIEAEYARIVERGGISLDEIKKYYESEETKINLTDALKRKKMVDELLEQAKVVQGEKMSLKKFNEAVFAHE
jgi:trigger factor